jgi:hypothetical protein
MGMRELIRERGSGWGARLSFAALCLVFSEFVVWQAPSTYNVLDWIGLAVFYLALAAVMLDLLARWNVNDAYSLLLLAGIYGLVDATLISHITTRDLPLSLIVRPLAAQPLAFMAALAAFQLLATHRTARLLEIVIALAVGGMWGIWTRWFPVVSEESIPEVDLGPALLTVGIALAVCGAIRFLLPPADIYRRDDWQLRPAEWAITGGVLFAALLIVAGREYIDEMGVIIVVTLLGYMAAILTMTFPARRGASILAYFTPPRRPVPGAWIVVVVPFLVAGAGGYTLPGSDDSSIQSSILIGALTVVGIVWLPVVSAIAGIRAFVQLAREEG